VLKFLLAFSAVFGALFLTAEAQSGPAGQPTFKSSASLVTIQASVRTSRGRPIRGLTSADFEVLDNGERRSIVSLSDTQASLTLALLIDTSGSMVGGVKLGMVQHAFDSVVPHLRPGKDEAAVFAFDSSLRQLRPFTSDLGSLRSALREIEPYGTTSLYDATAAAARVLADRTSTHKAIILFTDGTDTSSRLDAAGVSALASSIGVPVYVVVAVPPVDQRTMIEAPESRGRSNGADLRQLADWTGGLLVFATDYTEMTVSAARVLDELRHQYVLAIEPATMREWRRLEIRVRNTQAVIRARSGYFGG
jgi:Ca-activated chloride channel family protein